MCNCTHVHAPLKLYNTCAFIRNVFEVVKVRQCISNFVQINLVIKGD